MGFEISPEVQNTPKPIEEPKSAEKLVGDVVFRVANNLEMFNLPNKPPLKLEVFQKIAKQLEEQYDIAVRHDAIRAEIKSGITDLLNASSGHYQKAQEILDKAPQEAAPELVGNLRYLPEGIREEIARLALDKAPQEAAPELVGNLEYLQEGIREEIENEVKQIVQIVEREKLSQAEKRNPVLYKDIDKLDEQFLRKEFPKTGTKTLLLGKTLINNVILRIIPNHAFISWMNAYKAADTWKKAGFDYVPMEPIIRAYTSKDGKNTRVYSGVLGVSVSKYLDMYSNKNQHDYVREQVEKIKGILEEMGITHGHTHDNNFCILHERTPGG